jgi:hypothetical protein
MPKSRRSKKSSGRRYRRRRSNKVPKIAMKETHLGSIYVGRDGKAYKVVRLSSGKKGWRICRYPGIGPDIQPAKRGKRLSAVARRRPRCSFSVRQGLTPPQKAERVSYRPAEKASAYRIGHIEQGANGGLYKVSKNTMTGRKRWVKCRVSKGRGKRLSAAQRKRPYCMYRGTLADATENDSKGPSPKVPSAPKGPSYEENKTWSPSVKVPKGPSFEENKLWSPPVKGLKGPSFEENKTWSPPVKGPKIISHPWYVNMWEKKD